MQIEEMKILMSYDKKYHSKMKDASFQTERGPRVSPAYITTTGNKGEKERDKDSTNIWIWKTGHIQCK